MKNQILIIDDTEDKRKSLVEALSVELQGLDVELVVVTENNVASFFPKRGEPGTEGLETDAPEDRFCCYLESHPNIKLVIVDHDLSLLNTQISESVVASACQNAGVPHCRYSRTVRHQTPRQKLLELIEKSQIYSVKLDISDISLTDIGVPQESTRIVRCIYEGFEHLRRLIAQIDETLLNRGPSVVLATILEKPELDFMFQQYAGSYNVLAEAIKIYDILEQKNNYIPDRTRIIKNRLVYTIGFWLVNVIMKYPGVILNTTSASSYLNLNENDFIKHSEHFSQAKYSGPFEYFSKNGYWWRHHLDDLLISSESDNGICFLDKKGIKDILPSVCYVTNKSPAGYYCLFEKKQISLEASIGALNWMPSGADLSRVQKDSYEEVAPLLGY